MCAFSLRSSIDSIVVLVPAILLPTVIIDDKTVP